MIKMNQASLQDEKGWEKVSVKLPQYDVEKVVKATHDNPIWLHFGAGNIFRGFVGGLQQNLLNQGLCDRGIIAAETFDYDIVRKIYEPYDNLTMNITLKADGTMSREILGSITEAVCADSGNAASMERLNEIIRNPELQMISFTITEKGYALKAPDGAYMPVVLADFAAGPGKGKHAMSVVAGLLYERYKAGELPLAVVSMDNCSHNGEKLQNSILTIAREWVQNGNVERKFLTYLEDKSRVSFPWSMIDKITPRPAEVVEKALEADEIRDMQPIITSRNTYIAPFVNAEEAQYLVIEDQFPNGRPALEKAGVYMTDRDTVNCTETMKVTTCLNPLHTAMSVYGCMLGYTLISAEMEDEDIVNLVKTLGYKEGLPVVVDPKILSPKEFIDEVVEKRLTNPFMPDAPQRIVTDTSQKVGIRFGETIKKYVERGEDVKKLNALPLALAGWLRYLLAVDDEGNEIEISPDPLKETLQKALAGIVAGQPESCQGQLTDILSNAEIFGVNLVEIGLASKIEQIFREELAGNGAVRATLRKYLNIRFTNEQKEINVKQSFPSY
ncbi:fructuronate reductase [Hespellia stercorisuis DSM 15480]|uniref:Fructuronate reductase n=1 Tax=Hespellia stercorisuis DSM 15480 TaxID=1121950 RepID=A0A1M6MT74_9FIRM|nr:mannitol dehydrogenase family protein [Hespellia stercorisuis]SHJ86590.1 fructuronate reductase [Hespellia stercorisuis DSM 15480]